MSGDEFVSVETPCQVNIFRLSEIVAIITPNRPSKPAGWPDGYEAKVLLRNRRDSLLITEGQLVQMKNKLELQ